MTRLNAHETIRGEQDYAAAVEHLSLLLDEIR
jgi:hypothetical protein